MMCKNQDLNQPGLVHSTMICHMAQMSNNWGIYVHVPWCRRRCPYCDFYFEVGRPDSGFSGELLREYEARRHLWPSAAASTLYFGGGTPSVLPVAEIANVVDGLGAREAGLGPDAEITMEANPEDVGSEFIEGISGAGINRMSLGIQSFEDKILRQLGRKHSSAEAFSAVEKCTQSGKLRVSVDLIFGVPGESRQSIAESIVRVKELGVGHISAYLLTVEPGTALERHIQKGRSERPDDDKQAQAYEEIQEAMAENGFHQYEVSSYAVAGNESRHNRNYWGKGPYLGLGPAAHSMRILEDGRVERSKNPASISGWRSDLVNPSRETEVLSSKEALLESISFGLRDLLIGINTKELSIKHQCSLPKDLDSVLEKAQEKGWLTRTDSQDTRFHLTRLGVRFSDAIAREILSLD